MRGGESKVLWKFNFVPKLCMHVAFLNRSASKDEKEFLLEPYTVLTVVEVCYKDYPEDVSVPVIEVNVAKDNQKHELDLPLAPWI
mmetsp:Transcript_31725/g.66407  ORF Transcript_31725/g.66407 Transcript_31725/m.66407 type:complete len:85 (+) Transcript_31725:3-257(+)